MILRLGGLMFLGDAGDATFTITEDSIQGLLLGGVDMRREQIQRPGQHGEFALPGYLTGRAISWAGEIQTEDPAEQEHAMRSLSGLLADGGTKRLSIEGPSTSWIDVQRGGMPDLTMIRYGVLARYRFQAWAPDPRIYGVERTFAQNQKLYHHGNFAAEAVVTVQGAGGAYAVTIDGHNFHVTNPLPIGSVDVIEGWSGRVRRNGTLMHGGVSVAEELTIPPGREASWGTSGSGPAVVTARDTNV